MTQREAIEILEAKEKEIVAIHGRSHEFGIALHTILVIVKNPIYPPTLSDEEIGEILAQSYCLRNHSHKIVDASLIREQVKLLSGRIPAQQEIDNSEQKCECGEKRIYWHCHICNSEYWLCPYCGLASKCLNPPPEKPLPQQDKIEELKLEDLVTCDYADTDRIIDYILVLAGKINEIIAHNNQRED